MIQHYIKVAFRNLLKYKTQNLISIIGLSVGLLCFSICFYCSRYLLSVDHCFDNYDRLVDINLLEEELSSGTPAGLVEELMKGHGDGIEAYSRVAQSKERSFDLYLNNEEKLPYTFRYIEVDSFFNRLFTPIIIVGSWNTSVQTPNTVILTESAARKAFPFLKDAIGKQMVITKRTWSPSQSTPENKDIIYTIQAVIRDISMNISMSYLRKVDALILNDSEGLFHLKNDYKSNQTGVNTYGLLRKGQTTKELNELYRKNNAVYCTPDHNYNIVASPIGRNASFYTKVIDYSLKINMIGILILIVALLNFFHLQIGSIINRWREFSIRKVLGNNTFRLSMLIFTQLFILISIAALFMSGLIEIVTSKMRIYLYRSDISIEKNVVLWQAIEYIIILLVISLIISVCVAFYIRKGSVFANINNKLRRRNYLFRNAILGIQFFICWLFVSLTVAIYLQIDITSSTVFNTLTKAEKNSILSFKLDYTFMKNEEKLAIVDRIRQHSGVKDVLLSDDVGYSNGSSSRSSISLGIESDKYLEVNIMKIPPNFISFMNIPILSGQNMKNDNEMLVDDMFMDKIEGENLLELSDAFHCTISGILPSFCLSVYKYKDGRTPYIFLPFKYNDNIGHCYVKCYSGKEGEVRLLIAQLLKEVLPTSVDPKITTFLEDIIKKQSGEAEQKEVILFFSIVSLIITLLGVYAAITLDTERRQKEVAIRKVNGARGKQIVFLFARLYAQLLVITAILAFPIIYVILHMWKEIYQVSFNNGILYWGSIFIGITILTICTVIFKIWKIVHLNPVEVIKND